jgi:hypothetical protein
VSAVGRRLACIRDVARISRRGHAFHVADENAQLVGDLFHRDACPECLSHAPIPLLQVLSVMAWPRPDQVVLVHRPLQGLHARYTIAFRAHHYLRASRPPWVTPRNRMPADIGILPASFAMLNGLPCGVPDTAAHALVASSTDSRPERSITLVGNVLFTCWPQLRRAAQWPTMNSPANAYQPHTQLARTQRARSSWSSTSCGHSQHRTVSLSRIMVISKYSGRKMVRSAESRSAKAAKRLAETDPRTP